MEVEAALEGLEPTGDLTVTRSENNDNGYDWQVRERLRCVLKRANTLLHVAGRMISWLQRVFCCS